MYQNERKQAKFKHYIYVQTAFYGHIQLSMDYQIITLLSYVMTKWWSACASHM